MKKIITALGNPNLSEKIKKYKNIEILTKDIQYQEGIFEVLEKEKNIDFLILSENLLGKNKIENLIKKIKEKNNKLKIILVMENKNENIENILYFNGVNKIFYNNEKIINIIKYIENKNEEKNTEIKNELENLKQLLIKNNIYLEDEKEIKENNKEKVINKKIKKENTKVISIAGTGGIGKSIITLNLASILKENNQKILIIDFDILNKSLHTILGVNEYSKKIKNKLQKNNLINNKINIKELIIKINKKVDLISGINLIFDSKYKISSEKIKFIIEELKEYYDLIIIDTSSECFLDYTKNILKESDIILFLLEANLVEIKKAKNLLKIYNKNWKINEEKIKLIINKYNEESVDEKIIKNIFSEYKILGKIKFNKKYNNLINKNFEENIYTKNIKKDYKKITEKIIKLKNKKLNLFIENSFNRFKYNIYQKNNN